MTNNLSIPAYAFIAMRSLEPKQIPKDPPSPIKEIKSAIKTEKIVSTLGKSIFIPITPYK